MSESNWVAMAFNKIIVTLNKIIVTCMTVPALCLSGIYSHNQLEVYSDFTLS